MTAVENPMDPAAGAGTGDAAPPESVTVMAELRSHLWKSKAGISGIVICSLFVLAAVAGPWLPLIKDPTKQSLPDRLTPPVGWGGTWAHPLGTDQLGRDILARLIDGARISLLVSVTAVIIAAVLGTVLGLIAGYMGGKIDTLIVSAADVQMAFPGVLAGLILVAAFGPSVWLVIIVIAISSWMVFTRVGRGLVFTLKTSLYVEASELAGASSRRIMWRHLLPNLVSSLITLCVLELAAAILSESAFAFLGFGVQPPRSSWGLMIQQGRNYVTGDGWWIVTFAGMAIAIVVLGVNLLSLWLQSFNDVAEREQIVLERPGG
ncbi:MAG: ABC transporter permease [Acidimicrobiaceae bacterium]|nr:ABC transporter permease [Acidimicrobiaceae bacterium]MDE0493374.1 ABC transporter permease [Acidimicrobiaceae bacterium]MXY11801.1 ABC transporter permease [Acidimicrobiaceae bacterium]MXZ64241.1 ABC transporter permease [Acidimicrobiaceae bacterium]MYF34899.1 ABC transporter permease [Acidimicrobiaceae bacterium]